MTETTYDRHVDMYVEFVDRALAEDGSIFLRMAEIIRDAVVANLQDGRVLDLCCGEEGTKTATS